jgi:hypothetical protein
MPKNKYENGIAFKKIKNLHLFMIQMRAAGVFLKILQILSIT